jgi:hypothetical protein
MAAQGAADRASGGTGKKARPVPNLDLRPGAGGALRSSKKKQAYANSNANAAISREASSLREVSSTSSIGQQQRPHSSRRADEGEGEEREFFRLAVSSRGPPRHPFGYAAAPSGRMEQRQLGGARRGSTVSKRRTPSPSPRASSADGQPTGGGVHSQPSGVSKDASSSSSLSLSISGQRHLQPEDTLYQNSSSYSMQQTGFEEVPRKVMSIDFPGAGSMHPPGGAPAARPATSEGRVKLGTNAKKPPVAKSVAYPARKVRLAVQSRRFQTRRVQGKNWYPGPETSMFLVDLLRAHSSAPVSGPCQEGCCILFFSEWMLHPLLFPAPSLDLTKIAPPCEFPTRSVPQFLPLFVQGMGGSYALQTPDELFEASPPSSPTSLSASAAPPRPSSSVKIPGGPECLLVSSVTRESGQTAPRPADPSAAGPSTEEPSSQAAFGRVYEGRIPISRMQSRPSTASTNPTSDIFVVGSRSSSRPGTSGDGVPPSVGARSRPVSAMEAHDLQHTLGNSTEEEGVESEVRRIMLAEGIENDPRESSQHSLGGIEEDSFSIPVRREVTEGGAVLGAPEQGERPPSDGGGGGKGGRKGSVDESAKPFVRTRDSVDTQVRLEAAVHAPKSSSTGESDYNRYGAQTLIPNPEVLNRKP